ncbi:MAG: hypothetical protein KBD24_01065 [Candidatus Pacebacteria bacterium]|nr:hypothetical protein [Candidatus Paceibacterota bacterium]
MNALWKIARAVVRTGIPLFLLWVCASGLSVYAQEAGEGAIVEDLDTDAVVEDSAKSEAGDIKSLPYTVTPAVANEKAKPRDIIKKELIVTNNTAQRIDLYVTVKNIDPATGDQIETGPTESDLSTSLANWIEITRGVVELDPNESRKVPYLVHVNLTAKPGSYFARVGFHAGATRAEAEANDTKTELILNLEVQDDAKERLQLGNFMADDSVVLGDSVSFSYLLENVGNRMIEPRGSIRIFNRRGEEVGSVPLNADGEKITPENKRQLASVWSSDGRFGKYKAFLDLEYGENQLASVQDTVYFWVFPWKEMAVALGGVFVLAIIGTYIVHMRAMMQPAPARAYRSEPTTPKPAFAPMSAHAIYNDYVPMSAPPHRATREPVVGGKTVLLGRHERETKTAPTTTMQPHIVGAVASSVCGGAVKLSSRPIHTHATVQGSTVQLVSRRK